MGEFTVIAPMDCPVMPGVTAVTGVIITTEHKFP